MIVQPAVGFAAVGAFEAEVADALERAVQVGAVSVHAESQFALVDVRVAEFA